LSLIFKLLTAHSAYQPAVTDTILLLIDIKGSSQSRIFKKSIFFINQYIKVWNKISKDFCQILTVEKVIYNQNERCTKRV